MVARKYSGYSGASRRMLPLYVPGSTVLHVLDDPADMVMSDIVSPSTTTTGPIMMLQGAQGQVLDLRFKPNATGYPGDGATTLQMSTDGGVTYGTAFAYNPSMDLGNGLTLSAPDYLSNIILNRIYRTQLESWANKIAGSYPRLVSNAGQGHRCLPIGAGLLGVTGTIWAFQSGMQIGGGFRNAYFTSSANQAFSVFAVAKQGATTTGQIFRLGGTTTNYPIEFNYAASRQLRIAKRCASDAAAITLSSAANFLPSTGHCFFGVTYDGSVATFYAGQALATSTPAALTSAGGAYSTTVNSSSGDGIGSITTLGSPEIFDALWVSPSAYTLTEIQAMRDSCAARWGAANLA